MTGHTLNRTTTFLVTWAMGWRDDDFDDYIPLLSEPGKPLDLHVCWNKRMFPVVRVLQQRPVATTLLVEANNDYRVVKFVSTLHPDFKNTYKALPYQFPPPTLPILYPYAYISEILAYRKLKAANYPHIPRYFGNSNEAELIYPDDCSIPLYRRLSGPQPAIMVDFIEGELLTVENFTSDIGQKVLKSIRAMHELGVVHGDTNELRQVRNVLLVKQAEDSGSEWNEDEEGEIENGDSGSGVDVFWIDFERANSDPTNEIFQWENPTWEYERYMEYGCLEELLDCSGWYANEQ
jgi:hypothetical protein